MTDKVTDKVHVPPFNGGLSQPDYQERVQAAIKLPKVSSALSEEMATVGWHHMEWVMGDIKGVRILEADDVVIKLFGWIPLKPYVDEEYGSILLFQFRKPEADFIAEARRAQSFRLGFEFGCYVKHPLELPFRVHQITYYEVWGNPLLPVTVELPRLFNNNSVMVGGPIPVHVMNR